MMNKRLQTSVLDLFGGIVATLPPIYAVHYGPLGPIDGSLFGIAIGSAILVIMLSRTISVVFGRGYKSPFEHVHNLRPKSKSIKHLVLRDLLLSIFAIGIVLGEWTLAISYLILMVPVQSNEGFQNLADRLFGVTYTDT
jgi:uncharacterized membrane protein